MIPSQAQADRLTALLCETYFPARTLRTVRRRAVVAWAPGRVNLIGEHTDYNDGWVFPAAIDRGITVALAPLPDRCGRVRALDLNEQAEFSLESLTPDALARWVRYPAGVAWALQEAGFGLGGFAAVMEGDVPLAAGLSSSAAFELAVCTALQALSDIPLGPMEAALLCQHAENRFVGVPCGIMDQCASALGRRHCALVLDCRSHFYQHVTVASGAAVIVVTDSRVPRELAGSAYAERRGQCEAAVAHLRTRYPAVQALRDVDAAMLESAREALPDVVYRRARHVVTENARVLEGVAALQARNLSRFGALMAASHASLRDDYAVSCPELDVLVSLAQSVPGVYGSRLTGAGFGGCTVTLTAPEAVTRFEETVSQGYVERFSTCPSFYVCEPSDGARILKG